MEQQQTLKLSKEDAQAFVKAILNPSQPSNNLKEATSRYKKVMGNNSIK
ncbi:MAG: DUF1778 domain-containing protein [Cyanobacteria bacterium P01_D01_bin.116]